MSILIFDSDGLIKLVKAHALEKVLLHFECYISEGVFEESVVRGEDELYEDAFRIHALIEAGLLHVRAVNDDASNLRAHLGRGECSAFLLFSKLKVDAIVTDDRAFINILRKAKIPFIIPSDVISRMVELGHLSAEEGLKALDSIRIYITEESYLETTEVIRLCRKSK